MPHVKALRHKGLRVCAELRNIKCENFLAFCVYVKFPLIPTLAQTFPIGVYIVFLSSAPL